MATVVRISIVCLVMLEKPKRENYLKLTSSSFVFSFNITHHQFFLASKLSFLTLSNPPALLPSHVSSIAFAVASLIDSEAIDYLLEANMTWIDNLLAFVERRRQKAKNAILAKAKNENHEGLDGGTEVTKANSLKVKSESVEAEFAALCQAGMQDHVQGPNVTDLLSSLYNTHSLNEDDLPEEWFAFKKAQSYNANFLIRNVRNFVTLDHKEFVLQATEYDTVDEGKMLFLEPDWFPGVFPLTANAEKSAVISRLFNRPMSDYKK